MPIIDNNYLVDSFQFRFRNYATLSGNLDHWHIDYIRLSTHRHIHDTIVSDIAFNQLNQLQQLLDKIDGYVRNRDKVYTYTYREYLLVIYLDS